MYLNNFALGLEPLDLTATEEFTRLLASAQDLSVPVQLPVRYQSRNVVLNGLRLHLLEWGEADASPLVLIHGANQSAHNWDLIGLALAGRFRIIVPDLRGHGDSEWPRDGDTTRGAMAEDLRQLIASLELRNLILMGAGLGGLIMVSMLLENPALARRAVLEDATVGPPSSSTVTDEGARIGSFIRGATEFASMDEYIDRVAAFDLLRSREHIRRTLPFNLLQRVDGKFVSKRDPRLMELGAARAEPPTDLAELARIACPVLVVRGEHSRMVPHDAAQRVVQALRAGHMVTVPGAGHNPHSQNTAGFLAAVTPFLDGEEGTSDAR